MPGPYDWRIREPTQAIGNKECIEVREQTYFAPERPIFPTRARSGHLSLQICLNQGCHNLWIDKLGREYKPEIHCKSLDTTRCAGYPLVPKAGLRQGFSATRAANGYTVRAWGMKKDNYEKYCQHNKPSWVRSQKALTKCRPGKNSGAQTENLLKMNDRESVDLSVADGSGLIRTA